MPFSRQRTSYRSTPAAEVATAHPVTPPVSLSPNVSLLTPYLLVAVVFHIARVGTSSKAKSFVRSLEEDEEVNDLLFSTDESLDWALGEAQSRGQLNTWVSSLEASDRIGWRGANGWWGI